MDLTSVAGTTRESSDDRYDEFLSGVRRHFAAFAANSEHVFMTDAHTSDVPSDEPEARTGVTCTGERVHVKAQIERPARGLWRLYLDAAPPEQRQHRNCHCCRTFIERYGALASIDNHGHLHSVIWPQTVPPAYQRAVEEMRKAVTRARVVGVFKADTTVWGLPETGPGKKHIEVASWHHLALDPPRAFVNSSRTETGEQRMAEKREEYAMLQRGMADFTIDQVLKAHALLSGGQLFRSEKHIGAAAWLHQLMMEIAPARISGRSRENLVWRAVASAPAGWCHVRSGMLGTLLEDIAADMPFETIKRRFDDKMDPMAYRRPQAAPTAGNIAQAEKLVEKMGLAPALERRFAKLADVQTCWTSPRAPSPATPEGKGGVFAHLKPAAKAEKFVDTGAPPIVKTWAVFRATVLPTAEAIELLVPHGRCGFMAMVTACHPDAPPLLQWDRLDRRNPVSQYGYDKGSPAGRWGLMPGEFHPVTAVVNHPAHWDAERPLTHHANFALLVLAGARDSGYDRGGIFFPENLLSELHEVRATLEAHAAQSAIAGRDEAEVCGLCLSEGGTYRTTVRIVSRGVRTAYTIDRWE